MQVSQDVAGLDTDEVVGGQADEDGEGEDGQGNVEEGGDDVEEPGGGHGEHAGEQQEGQQPVGVVVHLIRREH